MGKSFLEIAILFFSVQLCAQEVGYVERLLVDESRDNREVPIKIYYPAESSGEATIPIQEASHIVTIGHGFVMSIDAYESLALALTGFGKIVILVDTEGGFSANHQSFGEDLSFASKTVKYEGLNEDDLFHNLIEEKYFLLGHSMGGGASVLGSSDQSESLAGIVLLAPAETNPSAIEAISTSNRNLFVLTGAGDKVTPPEEHHIPIYEASEALCKMMLSIEGGAHCFFAEENFNCDLGESVAMSEIEISREEQQQITYKSIDFWMNFTLSNDSNYLDSLEQFVDENPILELTNECVSLASESQESILFKCYPNPSNTYITLEGDGLKYYHIYNALGNLVYKDVYNENSKIDIKTFDCGLYYIKGFGESFIARSSFVKN